MAIFKYFESLTTSIKQSISQRFYYHAEFCATHQVSVIVAAIFIVLPLCYPALNVYYLNPASDVQTFFWEPPSSRIPISKSSFRRKCGALPSLHVERIIFKPDDEDFGNPQPFDKNVLDRELLLWTHSLQKKLENARVSYPQNATPSQEYTLSSLCFKPNGGNNCLVHSPIEFWNCDYESLRTDKDILNTLSKADKVSSFKIPIPLEDIFGNPIYNDAGEITSADSITLTYFLEDKGNCAEGQTLAIWDLLWKNVMSDEHVKAYTDFKEASKHVVFTFNRKKEFPVEFVGYLPAFLYISLSPGRLDCVKSKFGLAFSTLAQVFASLVVSLSICSLFGVTLTLVSWKLLPSILVIVGVENMFILTNAVTSTSMELPVKERVGKGLEKVGVSMTKTLFTGLSFFILCSATSIDSVQEFCIFTSVAMIVDYLLRMSFFITTLSIDLRRLEISDLYNQRVKTPLKGRNIKLTNDVRDGIHTSSTNYFYNRRVATYLIIIIFAMNIYQANEDLSSILSSFKNAFNDSHMSKSTFRNIITTKNTFYETPPAVHAEDAEAFWNVVNPKKKNRYFEIRNPKKYTLLRTFDQTNNQIEPTESTKPESSESSSFVLEFAGVKLSVRSAIKGFIWVLKFIISPAFGIIFATSSLVGCLVSSDQIGKNATSKSEKKISLPSPFHKNTLSLMSTPRVVTLRGRHSADVSLLCANPSGMIISTAADKHITSWDARRGASLKKLERYMRKCESCRCGDTGGMKTCISWPVRAMCMSEKIELAAAGFEDGVVRVWDINSGQATYILKDTVEDVESIMSVVSDTKNRVTCLQFVVPTSSSSMPQTPTYEKGYINFSVRPVSAPAMLLAAYRDGYFREWDLVLGQLVHVIATNQKGGISYLCVLDDGELDYNKNDLYIYTGARDGSVKCWVRSIYYSENELNLTSSTDPSEFRKSRWKSIYTITSETGSAITCISTKIVKTENGSYGIVITGAADGEVRVYDYLSGKLITLLSRGVTFKQRREKEKEERLLQKKLLIQQQKVKRQQFWSLKNNLYNNSNHNLSSDSDWYDDDDFDDDDFDDDDYDETEDSDDDSLSHQEAITNIIINLLEQESCPCGNTEYGGFSIVTSSVDEKVHVSKLARDVMDCTCISLRIENDSSSSKNSVKPAKWDGTISYKPKFIGRVSQPGGTAIVFIKENVVGVRKVKHSLASKNSAPRCHGAEGEWELWMLEINDPKVIEPVQKDPEDSDNEIDVPELSVQTVPLVSEIDIFNEEQQRKKKVRKRRDKESTGELKGFVRRRRNIFNTNNNVVGSNFGPTFPLPSNINHNHNHNHDHDHHHEEEIQGIQGQVVDFRQKSRRRGSVLQRIYPNHRQLSLLDEEDETNEFLPFAHVRQVVKIGDGGVAVAYGNFVKVVLFEE